MSRSIRLLSVPLLLGLFVGTSAGQTPADSVLRAVQSLYSSGSYLRAEVEGRRLLERDELSDSVRGVAEQIVAFALVAQEQPALAKEHFMNLLRLRPTVELDPVQTSPKILAVFNETRADFLAQKMRDDDSRARMEVSPPAGITYRTILFPGWEQLYHQRTTTGTVFLGAGVATLGAGITLEFLRSSARKAYLAATSPDEIDAKYRTYNRTLNSERWAFAAFAVVYLASEIDVFLDDPPVTLSFSPFGSRGGAIVLSYSVH